MAATLELVNAARIAFHDNKPTAYLTQTVGQTVATGGTATPVSFGNAANETWGAWSSGAPTLYTVPVTGAYEVSGLVLWTANATGMRDALLLHNGVNVTGSQVEIPGSSTTVNSIAVPPVQIRAAVGDTFQLATFQTSGGALNTDVSGAFASSMTVKWLRS